MDNLTKSFIDAAQKYVGSMGGSIDSAQKRAQVVTGFAIASAISELADALKEKSTEVSSS